MSDAPTQVEESQSQVTRSARVIALATLSSRILGMVRDVLTAYYFGTGQLVDAFVIAFLVPNLFRRLLGEGALGAAFLPVYSNYVETRSRKEADRLASNVFCLLGFFLAVIVLLGCSGSILWAGHAEAGSKVQLIAKLLAILLPYMFFICLTAICQGVLNTHRHFLAPALAPLVLNIFWIAGLLIAGSGNGGLEWTRIAIVAAAVLCGGVLQLAMQFPALKKHRFTFHFHIDFKDPGVRRIFATLLPIIVGIGAVQINSVSDSIIAETLVPGDGAVSFLYYANRLMQFPLAIIGVAMAVAAFPTFSKHYVRGEWSALQSEFLRALRITFFIALPASFGLIMVAEPLVQVLFARGQFLMTSGDPVQRQRIVVILYAAGVWAHCMVQVVMRAFYAIDDAKTPFRVSSYMVAANFCMNLLLVPHFREGGLALATSLSGMGTLLWLCLRLQRKIHFTFTSAFWVSIGKTLFASLCMAAVTYAIVQAIGRSQFEQWYITFEGKVIALSVVFWSGLLVYGGLAWLLLREEMRSVFRK